MKIIKNTLKRILPPMLRQVYRKIQYKIFGIEATFKGMNTSDIFDKIIQFLYCGNNYYTGNSIYVMLR